MTLDIDSLLKLAPLEERVYRLRCVEGWSMVIPWVGYSLSNLIKQVEPTGNAKFVEFTTLADPKQMPGVRSRVLDWPYVEGLRIDEAMHPLTLLDAGHVRPDAAEPERRAGAPCRAVEVRFQIGQVDRARSASLTRPAEDRLECRRRRANTASISNVNPNVDHPRWSQASERRIGEDGFFAAKAQDPDVQRLHRGRRRCMPAWT